MLLLVIVFIKSIENKLGQKLVQGCGLGRGVALAEVWSGQGCGLGRSVAQAEVWPRQRCGQAEVWPGRGVS